MREGVVNGRHTKWHILCKPWSVLAQQVCIVLPQLDSQLQKAEYLLNEFKLN